MELDVEAAAQPLGDLPVKIQLAPMTPLLGCRARKLWLRLVTFSAKELDRRRNVAAPKHQIEILMRSQARVTVKGLAEHQSLVDEGGHTTLIQAPDDAKRFTFENRVRNGAIHCALSHCIRNELWRILPELLSHQSVEDGSELLVASDLDETMPVGGEPGFELDRVPQTPRDEGSQQGEKKSLLRAHAAT